MTERQDRLETELHEAKQAKQLKSQLLNDFFEEKDAQLWDAFKRVPVRDRDALIEVHHAVIALDALRSELQAFEDSGKLAQAELDRENQEG